MLTRSWRELLSGTALLACAGAVGAQCPDQWFPGGWRIGQPAVPRVIAVWDPDGGGPLPDLLVLGGDFHLAGGAPASSIAAWDGQTWSALGTGFNDPVTGLAVFNGQLFASTAAGVHRFDGSSWIVVPDHPGQVMGVLEGELIVASVWNYWAWNGVSWRQIGGGCFGAIGAHQGRLVTAQFQGWSGCVRMQDGAGGWVDIANGLSGFPQWGWAYSILGNGNDLYMAGTFYAQGSGGIGRWDGTSWQPMGAANYNSIGALHLHNGELLAGGLIDVGGAWARVARWDGQEWIPIGTPSPDSSGPVGALGSFRGDLIVAGSFTSFEGQTVNGVARWDGSAWHALGVGLDLSSGGTVLALHAEGPDLFVGGVFTTVEGLRCGSVAYWNGAAWDNMGGGFAGGNVVPTVVAITRFGPDLIFAGYFDSAGGVAARNIAAWNGSQWRALGAGPGIGVRTMVEYQGMLYAGGSGQPASGSLARWNGATWEAVPTQLAGGVDALAVYNGELYVGGGAINVAGGGRGLGRWNGSQWLPVGTPDLYIHGRRLAVYNNELIVGANTSTFPDGVVRFNGQEWLPLGSGISGQAESFAVVNGELLVTGRFSTAGGAPANNAALWNGSQWRAPGSGLQPGPEQEGRVNAAVAYSSGFAVGGSFRLAGGALSPLLARWGPGVPACAANCDCSTIPPILSVADFACFLNRFAAGDLYANCDASAVPPVLNIADFSCFLNRFAAGCP